MGPGNKYCDTHKRRSVGHFWPSIGLKRRVLGPGSVSLRGFNLRPWKEIHSAPPGAQSDARGPLISLEAAHDLGSRRPRASECSMGDLSPLVSTSFATHQRVAWASQWRRHPLFSTRQRLARDTQPLRAIETAQSPPAHTINVSVLARTCPCIAHTHTPTGGFQRTSRLIVAHTRLWHTQSELWIAHGLGAEPRSYARSLTCRHHSAVGPFWSTFTPVPLGGRRNGRQQCPWSAACPPCCLLVAVLPLGMEIGRFHWRLASLPLCRPAAAWLRRCDRKQAVHAPLYSGSCAEFAPALSPFEEQSTQQRFFSDPSRARVQWLPHRLRFLRRRHPLPHA